MLRRSVGVAEPFHVAPHLTLVPPVNVAAQDLPAVTALLRRVAGASHPFDLDVGPVATFLPETPTLHLAVDGADLDGLRSLRGHLRAGPFDRPDVWPFHPHVTICEQLDTALIEAGMRAFAGLRQRWSCCSLHLLEQHRHGPEHPRHGQACWVPVREEPLGGPLVVGRGGVELVLRTVSMVEPAAADLLGVTATVPGAAGRAQHIVVVAEQPDEPDRVLGVAAGRLPPGASVVELDRVSVVADRRREGIAGQVLRAWVSAAATRGAAAAVVAAATDAADAAFLVSQGFEPMRSWWFRGM